LFSQVVSYLQVSPPKPCIRPSSLQYILFYLLTYIHTYILTYLLTPCSTVFLEKLTGSQSVRKFPAFYGTRRFITAFTSARHPSLSWASSTQTAPSSYFLIFILILPFHLRLVFGVVSFPHISVHDYELQQAASEDRQVSLGNAERENTVRQPLGARQKAAR